MRILLERKDVDPGKVDAVHGWTPVLQAANKGHKWVARTILERGMMVS